MNSETITLMQRAAEALRECAGEINSADEYALGREARNVSSEAITLARQLEERLAKLKAVRS